MANPIITKCNSSNPYKNGTIVLATTGKGDFETRDVAVSPTGTYANTVFSPSGEMNWAGSFNKPGEIVHNV